MQTPTTMPAGHYRAFGPVVAPDRTWPAKRIAKAPRWLSADLRGGNQALIDPMTPSRKMRMFELLVALDYKKIEIDLPPVFQTDPDFVRQLITDGRAPEDVIVSVLTQVRGDLTIRTVELLIGAHCATIRMYNATVELFQRVVFDIGEIERVNLATRGTELVVRYASKHLGETESGCQYNLGIFIQTPMDSAVEVYNAAAEIQRPDKDREIIFSLLATVEHSTPSTYVGQTEHSCRNTGNRELVVVSLYLHNDRGIAVAATELDQTAGADRVGGCLFGYDERAGNVDLMTLALNLYTQGADPQLDFHGTDHVCRTVRYCTGLLAHPRQPCAGNLVYTAFSGPHQDTAKKGPESLEKQAAGAGKPIIEIKWETSYLPIDSHDVGRDYEAVVQVNSQSDESGVTYLMKIETRMELPHRLQMGLNCVAQQRTDVQGGEPSPKDIVDIFPAEYLSERDRVLTSVGSSSQNGQSRITATINDPKGCNVNVEGEGNGPVSAFVNAPAETDARVRVPDYSEYAFGSGGGTKAAVYVEYELGTGDGTQVFWGVGVDPSTTSASMRAILSALNWVACA